MNTRVPAVQYQVTFLLDLKNNWLEPYLRSEWPASYSHKFSFKISYNYADVIDQDIVFILGYTKILDASFLGSNKLNLVIHASRLPEGKGFAPVQWQILEGKNRIPVCLIEASEAVDSGEVISRDYFELSGFELYDEIRRKQALATIKMVRNFLSEYPIYSKEPQTGSESFYRKRKPSDGELDISKSIKDQFNLLRIGNNEEWPSFFYLGSKKYILKIYTED